MLTNDLFESNFHRKLISNRETKTSQGKNISAFFKAPSSMAIFSLKFSYWME